MDTHHDWANKMIEQLSTAKAGVVSGLMTAFVGWFTSVGLVGLLGIVGTIATLYFGYARHQREEALHQVLMRNAQAKKPPEEADDAVS